MASPDELAHLRLVVQQAGQRARGNARARTHQPLAQRLGDLAESSGKILAQSTGPVPLAPGYAPVGSVTGAPPPLVIQSIQILPGPEPTRIVGGTRENRIVSLIAPFVAFTIYVGGTGVNVRNGFGLVPALEHDISLPGIGELWAVTDAPVVLPLRVQIATLLIGDRERVIVDEDQY